MEEAQYLIPDGSYMAVGSADHYVNNNDLSGIKKTRLSKRMREGGSSEPARSIKQTKVPKSSSASSTAARSAAAAGRSSSKYRGVTRHRWTGRFEAHLWDKNSWNQSQSKKGRQVYLGAYDDEDIAAHAYDLAALKYWGTDTIVNFPIEKYEKEMEEMQQHTREEYIASLRRKSNGFSRGVSKYRGVARHHHNGRWEARIGRVYGNKYLYLGTYSTQEEAAIAYDIAAIQYRGMNAVTNFDMSNYLRWMKPPEGGVLHQPVLMNNIMEPRMQMHEISDSHSKEAIATSTFKASADAGSPRIIATDTRQHHQLMQVCTQTIRSRHNFIPPSLEEIDPPNNMMMMMMHLENLLGTSDAGYGSHVIQDQASATCSIPDITSYGGGSSQVEENGHQPHHSLHQLPCRLSSMDVDDVFACPPYSAYRLDKLMAEYNDLLQSSSPKEKLEKGTLSTIMDTLSDTASSSTSSSISSASAHELNRTYLNHIVKPGGYVAGLLSPQEELIKSTDMMFETLGAVAGNVNDSICSSNDLSSIQDLISYSISDPTSYHNGIYPIHYNSCTPNDTSHLMLDSSLSNTLACLLPTSNTLHHQYLQTLEENKLL